MSNIKIKMNFYDKSEKEKIKQNFPTDFNILAEFEDLYVEVPYEDFKTYQLFRLQSDKSSKFGTFRDLSRLAEGFNIFNIAYDFKETTGKLVYSHPNRVEETDITNALGVAGGLALISTIYGLTQADWKNIGIQRHKDFDFKHLSSIADRYLVLETKGSAISDGDNSFKSSSVSKHKSNILEKKGDSGFIQKYDKARDTCLGIITVADRENFLQCWLVDPDYLVQDFPPLKLRLLKRLYYYYDFVYFISQRAFVTILLANRIKIIEKAKQYTDFDNFPLINNIFEPLIISDAFINNRARITENGHATIIGNTYLTEQEIIFVGLKIDIIELLIEQNFDLVLNYKASPRTFNAEMICKVEKTNENQNLLNKYNAQNIRVNNNFIYFDIDSEVTQASSGVVYCLIEGSRTGN